MDIWGFIIFTRERPGGWDLVMMLQLWGGSQRCTEARAESQLVPSQLVNSYRKTRQLGLNLTPHEGI